VTWGKVSVKHWRRGRCVHTKKARQQNISISPIYEVNPSIRWCCSEDIIKKNNKENK
jgi:hypothetical protein